MLTVVTTVVLLLAAVGSLVLAVTDEFAVIEAATTGGAVQDHPAGGDTDWNVVFAGVASVKLTLAADAGPLLVTVCV
jgi:hypothetical protein